MPNMLPHDKDGFLIGQKIEVSDEAMKIWRAFLPVRFT
jgi:hypothetical protein